VKATARKKAVTIVKRAINTCHGPSVKPLIILYDLMQKQNAFTNEKKQKRNGIVAIRAVAHKIARAVFHMLKNKRAFDIERAFS
jgi:hypothetical protein